MFPCTTTHKQAYPFALNFTQCIFPTLALKCYYNMEHTHVFGRPCLLANTMLSISNGLGAFLGSALGQLWLSSAREKVPFQGVSAVWAQGSSRADLQSRVAEQGSSRAEQGRATDVCPRRRPKLLCRNVTSVLNISQFGQLGRLEIY